MSDEVRLTRKEWETVEEQCRGCKYWSYSIGCICPDAGFPEPVSNCKVFNEQMESAA